jgi:predicted naringenin-chalcone synthase
MCTLHFDPSLHAAEQLVVQSLFADGHIAYRLSKNKPNGNGFRVLSTLEEIIPQSLTDMTWILSQNSFRMTLAREVPQKVAEAVPAFIQRLFAEAGLNSEQHLSHAIAALHPGGPRIIDGLKEILGLEEEALKDSRKILFECGNMSSATLPHIFHSVAQRNDVSSGTLVMGLAFGPGLTMVGVLLEKV